MPLKHIYILMFIYLFLRVKETESRGEAERERGGERILSRLCTVNAEPDGGLQLTNYGIMT